MKFFTTFMNIKLGGSTFDSQLEVPAVKSQPTTCNYSVTDE